MLHVTGKMQERRQIPSLSVCSRAGHWQAVTKELLCEPGCCPFILASSLDLSKELFIDHRLISTCSKIFLDPNGVKRMGPSARLPNLYYILLRLMILIRNHYRRDRDIEIVMI